MRGFNIQSFKSAIGPKDILRTNKFLMQFFLPPGLSNDPRLQEYMETTRYLEYWCEASNLPGYGVTTHDVRRFTYGPFEKRPFAPQFTDITVGFYSDGNGDIWRLMTRWLELVMNKDARQGINTQSGRSYNIVYPAYELSYREEYVTDIKLIVFNQMGDPVKIVNFREAFPIIIPDVPLNWSDTNSVLRLQVVFTFVDWYIEDYNPNEWSSQGYLATL